MLNLLENSAPQHKSRFQKIKEKLFGTKTQNLEDLEISDVEMRDLKFDKEFAPIKEWIANCSDPKAAARMYETKYLSRLSPAAREIAAKIDKDFGTKVFMSDTNNPESLQLIYNELLEWKKAGKQDVKFPKVIDCTKIDELYVNSTSVAYHQHDGKKLSFSSSESDEILFALRHEMMHENDSYIDFDFGVWNRVNSEYIIKNKKYYDEIQYGLAANDINPAHADYAYTNRKEFLAVRPRVIIQCILMNSKMSLSNWECRNGFLKCKTNRISAQKPRFIHILSILKNTTTSRMRESQPALEICT